MTAQPSDLLQAVHAVGAFAKAGLTHRVGELEQSFDGCSNQDVHHRLAGSEVTHDLLRSAQLLKQVAGEINVVIHAIGILLALPHILVPGETVQSLSLGAGNTGKAFDLETSHRVAEFKFIQWRLKSNVIRQNGLFKDFYLLAEHQTAKRKCVYVTDATQPLKFLKGKRALKSVMSRNTGLWEDFRARYGSQFTKVREYYATKADEVAVIAIHSWLNPY
jgi:hypothetical protein